LIEIAQPRDEECGIDIKKTKTKTKTKNKKILLIVCYFDEYEIA